jgi:hypothetical protein
MYVKRWIAFASVVIAASLPAYGNSSTLISQDIMTSSPDRAGIGSPMKLEQCLLFRNALQDARRNSIGMPMSHWDSSQLAEISREHEHITSLPEPDSGMLLSIGLFALIYLSRTRLVVIHEN